MPDDFIKSINLRIVRNSIIGLMILGTIWGVLNSIIGDGIVTGIINITFMIVTAIISALVLWRSLAYLMNNIVALFVSLIVWFFIFSFYRFIVQSILSAIF